MPSDWVGAGLGAAILVGLALLVVAGFRDARAFDDEIDETTEDDRS